MKMEIRNESVIIEGYVNAVERNSKPLMGRTGKFIERICKGAFNKALRRNNDIKILLNHDWNKVLGGTKEGNLELNEDNIGLHTKVEIRDAETVQKAKNGDLIGWSFGFSDREVENSVEKGMPLREVRDLDLYEVSILDRTKIPAYDGTLAEIRSINNQDVMIFRSENIEENIQIIDNTAEQVAENIAENTAEEVREEVQETVPKQQENVVENKSENVDYSAYEDSIKSMKGA